MDIEFTNHAKRKIKQRELDEDWIIDTVTDPEFVQTGYNKRKLAYKRIDKLYLKVVYVKENGKIIILTAHFEKRFKPNI